MRYLQSGDRLAGIGVGGDDLIVPNSGHGLTVGQVEARTDGSLVEISFAIGFTGRQAQHRHHRDSMENDDSDIGNPLVGDGGKNRIKINPFLD